MVHVAAPTPQALGRLLDGLPAPDDGRAVDRAEAMAVADDALVDRAIALLDLTRLEATDTPAEVRALADRAIAPAPGAPATAAVCVWPDLVADAASAVAGTPVRAACVAGAFPSGRSPLAVRAAEVEAAVGGGAQEVDVVLDRAALAAGRDFDACQQVATLRDAGRGATCKVILETGALPDARAVARAGWVAMLGGADFLKTSTGKDGPGASPAAVLVLVQQALAFEERFGRPVGVKASGGIRDGDRATGLLALVRAVAGSDWLTPDRLRLGASAVLDDLLARRAA